MMHYKVRDDWIEHSSTPLQCCSHVMRIEREYFLQKWHIGQFCSLDGVAMSSDKASCADF
jgi:hypothetical protein